MVAIWKKLLYCVRRLSEQLYAAWSLTSDISWKVSCMSSPSWMVGSERRIAKDVKIQDIEGEVERVASKSCSCDYLCYENLILLRMWIDWTGLIRGSSKQYWKGRRWHATLNNIGFKHNSLEILGGIRTGLELNCNLIWHFPLFIGRWK